MRRTNKRNNLKKRRKTLKKRFSKRGGIDKECGVCGKKFINLGLYNSSYQQHINTHPICKYCKRQFKGIDTFKDIDTLIEHLCDGKIVHPDMPNACKLANDIKYDDGSNLIDKLRNNVTKEIGSLPELTKFYEKIENKEKSIKKKEADRLKKEKKAKETEAKMLERETTRKKEEARQLAIETAKKEAEVAEKAKLEADKARQAEIRAKKQEQKEREQKENLARELEVKTMGSEDKLAKGIENKIKQNIKKEQKLMGEEDRLAQNVEEELRRQLVEASTVEDVQQIIDANINNESSAQVTTTQKTININELITQEDFNNLQFVDFLFVIQRMYPAIKEFNNDIREFDQFDINNTKFNPYKYINCGILFLVGIINNKLKELKINLKLVLKGGKAAQMILSEYKINNKNGKLIKSNDVDILLIQEGIYDYEFLLNFASQLSDLIQQLFGNNDIFDNNVISLLKPPMLNNKNIVKISYMYFGIDPYSGFPNRNYDYIPLSDIDFKQVENDFFSPENIVSSTSNWTTNNRYTFNLLYYHQNLPTFIAEKEYYMSIYNEIIQKTPDDVDCDCSLPNDNNNECKRICNYRDLMLEKFNKYIIPLKQVLQTISNK